LYETTAASFVAVAAALFVTELTDKDSLLLIAVSTKVRVWITFLAGATAFVITTTIIITLGAVLIAAVPVDWVRVGGGLVMIGYGLWQARGLVSQRAVNEEESKIPKAGSLVRVFVALVVTLAVLDLAGDATEVLTIVMVANYRDPIFVFSSVCTGLLAATAVETTLGSRLGRLLTPRRLRIGSAVVFVGLGSLIVFFGYL